MHYIRILITVTLFAVVLPCVSSAQQEKQHKPGGAERKADRSFVRQDFDKAMVLYEQALNEATPEHKAALHLKMARLYFMLRDYADAAGHYASAKADNAALLSMSDICGYIDALRFQNKNREAEAIALDHAYKDIYSRYQRYRNTLDALTMKHSMTADDSYLLRRLSVSSPYSDYWVGMYGSQPFYALSLSRFNNPDKLFYHRTKYIELDETDTPTLRKERTRVRMSEIFRNVPLELQIGPLAFNADMSMMVATSVAYGAREQIIDNYGAFVPFQSKLSYSELNKRKTRFSRFRELFPQAQGYSYGHPHILGGGRSILFTSNMPGGFGGLDIYIMHWNESRNAWDQPVNLGPAVNTEGDEIFPILSDGTLIFSSNGHPGYGGYDLYSTPYDPEMPANSAVHHFPYPINSGFNDTYMMPLDGESGYVVSDRDLRAQDDIYYYAVNELPGLKSGKPFFGLSEEEAILGGETLIRQATEAGLVTQVVTIGFSGSSMEADLMLTVYFDFDKWTLTRESRATIDAFIRNNGFEGIKGLELIGTADEMGSDKYNMALSIHRAQSVANYLSDKIPGTIPMQVEGRGRILLTPEELELELKKIEPAVTDRERQISVNRKARRVDIYKSN